MIIAMFPGALSPTTPLHSSPNTNRCLSMVASPSSSIDLFSPINQNLCSTLVPSVPVPPSPQSACSHSATLASMIPLTQISRKKWILPQHGPSSLLPQEQISSPSPAPGSPSPVPGSPFSAPGSPFSAPGSPVSPSPAPGSPFPTQDSLSPPPSALFPISPPPPPYQPPASPDSSQHFQTPLMVLMAVKLQHARRRLEQRKNGVKS
ncbi:hypothetical protein QE152_g39022 [Popillia japonica]|uniref:Uncharacterized protein n=1 Tax=Popillia japonica TaxID=7064 RepID=A0AAW1HUZ3_POPJA